MSNYLAIAAVTESIKQLLYLHLVDQVTGVEITTERPDNPVADPQPRVNIFLYQAAPSPSLRNDDLPTRNHRGRLVQLPEVVLDLYYLFTFYGDDTELIPQQLMGAVLGILNAYPILTPEFIDESLENAADPDLKEAGVSDQIDLVRITPFTYNLEQLSRLWSIMDVAYSLSAAYTASAVFIQTPGQPVESLPVRETHVYAIPTTGPALVKVFPVRAELGQTITLEGKSLKQKGTRVRIGPTFSEPLMMTNKEIRVNVPDEGLVAGLHGVQVCQDAVAGGQVFVGALDSDVLSLVVLPRITNASPITGTRGESVAINVNPPVVYGQPVSLIIGNEVLFMETPDDARIGEKLDPVNFVIPVDFPTGSFLLTIQVAGARSKLYVDPQTQRYSRPVINIT